MQIYYSVNIVCIAYTTYVFIHVYIFLIILIYVYIYIYYLKMITVHVAHVAHCTHCMPFSTSKDLEHSAAAKNG